MADPTDKGDKDDKRDDAVPVAVVPTEIKTGPVRARLSAAVSGGVEALNAGIGVAGATVSIVGEGVQKVAELTQKVPLVNKVPLGTNLGKLGVAVSAAGESMHAFPAAARTQRGRLLVRSTLIGFFVIALWISAIAAFELQTDETVDFRPQAEKILVQLGKGADAIGDVYEHASPRFQEMVRKERFVDDMTDMVATVGKFREVTAINETLVTTGPTGRIGRVSLTAAYANGVCKGSISFHWDPDQGEWKMLGIGLELPAALKVTQLQREQRVAACKDPEDRKSCDVRDRAETILEQLSAGKAGEIWDDSSDVFKQQAARNRFVALQQDHATTLGAYRRILRVTEARVIGGTSATFDVVVEFERASGVRAVLGFERQTKASRWQLRSFKLAVPMPRADDAWPANR